MSEPIEGIAEPRLNLGFYRLKFSVGQRYDYPGFSGSAWRGVMGQALREQHCPNGLLGNCDCEPACEYARLFEPPLPENAHALPLAGLDRLPSPWILHDLPQGPLKSGEEVFIGLTLIGDANVGLPSYVAALSQGAEHLELADGLRLNRVERWHRSGGWRQIDHAAVQPVGPSHGGIFDHQGFLGHDGRVRVRLETPLRLRVGGQHLGPKTFDPAVFCMAVVRRVSLLAAAFGPGPVEADFPTLKQACNRVQLVAHGLEWVDWSRRSNRQRRKHPLGGVRGWFDVSHLPPPLKQWLLLGQATHVGKAVNMGLGRYSLDRKA